MPDRKLDLDAAGKVSAALRRMKDLGEGSAASEAEPAPPTTPGTKPAGSSIGDRLNQSTGAFAALQAAIRKSRGDFVGRLAQYRDTLANLDLETGDPRQTDASLELAMRIAHRLSGTSKTFGFSALGDAARDAENAINAYRADRGSQELRAASIARINRLSWHIAEICSNPTTCPA